MLKKQTCKVGVWAVLHQLHKHWPSSTQSKSEQPQSHHTHRHSALSLPSDWQILPKIHLWKKKRSCFLAQPALSLLAALSHGHQHNIKERSRSSVAPAAMALHTWYLTTCKTQSWKHLTPDINLTASLVPYPVMRWCYKEAHLHSWISHFEKVRNQKKTNYWMLQLSGSL